MQDTPLNLAQILEHAATFHGQAEVVSRRVEDGSIHRYTYVDALRRTRQLATALQRLGVQPGDRIGTLAWNTFRHLECWYAIAGQGAICHTINPRLFTDQLVYIINDAADRWLFVDITFVSLLERIQEQLPTVEGVIVLTDAAQMPATGLRRAVDYESLIHAESDEFDWPRFPEQTPSSLCYTSGTTGLPKGVVYTHRSNFLHAYASNGKDAIGASASDTVMIVVPMYHANGWGLAYSAPMSGAALILPGARLDGESLHELLQSECVTLSAAVPTVWNELLSYLKSAGQSLPYLREVVIGGAAVPKAMLQSFLDDYDVNVVHGWGMTETSPIGTACRLKPRLRKLDPERQLEIRLKQGTPLFGVSLKLVDEAGRQLPHDGVTNGRLLIKGPWIVKRYYGEQTDAVDEDGWFDTGDIATIDEYGYMQITDRAKDLIKSGGEWISSIELENATMEHCAVTIAAAIGVPHPKWGERPVLFVQTGQVAETSSAELLEFLSDRVAKWWLPDEIFFVDELPLSATGKANKRLLREQLRSPHG